MSRGLSSRGRKGRSASESVHIDGQTATPGRPPIRVVALKGLDAPSLHQPLLVRRPGPPRSGYKLAGRRPGMESEVEESP